MKRNPASPPRGFLPASKRRDDNRSVWRRFRIWDRFWGHRFKRFEEGLLFRVGGVIVAAIGVASVVFTAAQFYLYLDDRKADRIQRAWSTIGLKVGGNIGKGDAFNVLFDNGTRFRTLDLRCKTIGAWIDEKCAEATVISGLKIEPPIVIDLIKAGGTIFEDSIFTGASEVTVGKNVKFSDSGLSGGVFVPLVDTSFLHNDLSFATLDIRNIDTPPSVKGNNISGLVVEFNENRIDEVKLFTLFHENWAWADIPPIVLNAKGMFSNSKLVALTWFCDPKFRNTAHTDAALYVGDAGDDMTLFRAALGRLAPNNAARKYRVDNFTEIDPFVKSKKSSKTNDAVNRKNVATDLNTKFVNPYSHFNCPRMTYSEAIKKWPVRYLIPKHE